MMSDYSKWPRDWQPNGIYMCRTKCLRCGAEGEAPATSQYRPLCEPCELAVEAQRMTIGINTTVKQDIIEIHVGDNRPPVTKWLAVAGAVAFGLAVVWMVYIVCMDLLPYVLRVL